MEAWDKDGEEGRAEEEQDAGRAEDEMAEGEEVACETDARVAEAVIEG